MATFFGDRDRNGMLQALGGVAAVAALVAVLALLWATVWVYGDETRRS